MEISESESSGDDSSPSPSYKTIARKEVKARQKKQAKAQMQALKSRAQVRRRKVPASGMTPSFVPAAAMSMRDVLQALPWPPKIPSQGQEREIFFAVRERYLLSCAFWHVKPNSQALRNIASAKVADPLAAEGAPDTSYDFVRAHLGDRGVVCVLSALAHDPRCASVSLAECGLTGASAPVVACFLEYHPRVRECSLSKNGFSFEAGEVLLSALTRREQRGLEKVSVDLGGTFLAWGRDGQTVGPPCGSLWATGAGSATAAKFAPSSYETLRSKLDGTHRVTYGSRSPSPSKREGAGGRAEADGSKRRLFKSAKLAAAAGKLAKGRSGGTPTMRPGASARSLSAAVPRAAQEDERRAAGSMTMACFDEDDPRRTSTSVHFNLPHLKGSEGLKNSPSGSSRGAGHTPAIRSGPLPRTLAEARTRGYVGLC